MVEAQAPDLLEGPEIAGKLRKQKEQVLRRWENLVRQEMNEARQTKHATLINSLPEFLDDLCDALERAKLQGTTRSNLIQVARVHAEDRAAYTDYSVEQVIREYELLRKIIFDVLEVERPLAPPERETILDAVSTGMAKAGSEYAELAAIRERNVQAKLRQTEGLFETIFELAGSGKAVVDLKTGRFSKANRALQRMLGYTTDELAQKTFTELTHPDDRDWQMEIFRKNVQSHAESWTIEKRYLRKDGSTMWAIVSGALIRDANDEPVQAISTIMDITPQRDALKVIDRYNAALTHDLRTPLAAIKMIAQLSARQESDAKMLGRFSQIVANVSRADRMIQDLLDASQIRAGAKIPIHVVECDLGALVHEVVASLAAIHGDRFKVEAPAGIKGWWSASGLKRALENLGNNAVKYGSSGTAIMFRLERREDRAVISVHNLGNPIRPEEASMLFQEYHRSPSARASGKVGWGLGLTIVKGVANSHGGKVSVRSSREDGTTFELFLPIDCRGLAEIDLQGPA